MESPDTDRPLFFQDDEITDQEGREWRVVDTPNRVRVGGSNKPAYLLTRASNPDLNRPEGQRIWVRMVEEVEDGRFKHPDGRGHPGGVAPEVLPIRGWAVCDWYSEPTLKANATTTYDAGLHGLFVVVRNPEQDLEAAIEALTNVNESLSQANLGLCVPSLAAVSVMDAAERAGIQGIWLHDCGVDEGLWDETGAAIYERYQSMGDYTLFAGVSFVDDDIDPDLAASVDAVQKADMVPITSGTEADLEMIRSRAVGGRLAFAGGLDPVSVEPMLAYITDAIASAGISHNYYELHPGKCRGFAESCKNRSLD